MKKLILLALASLLSTPLLAKLAVPAPTDEARAKAAEAAAKTAWTGKLEAYQLCKSQDKVAVQYYKGAKAAGKDTRAAVVTPACADPGAFVYTPAPAATAPAPVAAAATPAAAAKKP